MLVNKWTKPHKAWQGSSSLKKSDCLRVKGELIYETSSYRVHEVKSSSGNASHAFMQRCETVEHMTVSSGSCDNKRHGS